MSGTMAVLTLVPICVEKESMSMKVKEGTLNREEHYEGGGGLPNMEILLKLAQVGTKPTSGKDVSSRLLSRCSFCPREHCQLQTRTQ